LILSKKIEILSIGEILYVILIKKQQNRSNMGDTTNNRCDCGTNESSLLCNKICFECGSCVCKCSSHTRAARDAITYNRRAAEADRRIVDLTVELEEVRKQAAGWHAAAAGAAAMAATAFVTKTDAKTSS